MLCKTCETVGGDVMTAFFRSLEYAGLPWKLDPLEYSTHIIAFSNISATFQRSPRTWRMNICALCMTSYKQQCRARPLFLVLQTGALSYLSYDFCSGHTAYSAAPQNLIDNPLAKTMHHVQFRLDILSAIPLLAMIFALITWRKSQFYQNTLVSCTLHLKRSKNMFELHESDVFTFYKINTTIVWPIIDIWPGTDC